MWSGSGSWYRVLLRAGDHCRGVRLSSVRGAAHARVCRPCWGGFLSLTVEPPSPLGRATRSCLQGFLFSPVGGGFVWCAARAFLFCFFVGVWGCGAGGGVRVCFLCVGLCLCFLCVGVGVGCGRWLVLNRPNRLLYAILLGGVAGVIWVWWSC